jgi:hypothetical protein
MAVGFPAKVSYVNGDVFSASDINDTNGTLNLINPTAKGDLFVGSAANTYTKLAVGGDYSFMQALASGATGTQWASGLTAYTPTVTASSGSITSVTANGYWLRLGKLVFVSFNFKITNNGTGSGNLQMSLPYTNTANVRHTGTSQETDVLGFNAILYVLPSTATAVFNQISGAYCGGTGNRLQGQIWYEVA